MNQRVLGFFAVLALAAPVSGCLTTGELGGGSFGYACPNQGNDAACDTAFDGQELALPRKVAVGSVFSLSFHGDASSPVAYVVYPASADILSPSGSGFVFQKPLFAAVLARDVGGRVGDFIHLKGAAVDHLAVLKLSNVVNDLKLSVDQSVTLHVVPMDETGEVLAGAFTYTWTDKGAGAVIDFANETDLSGNPKSNTIVVTGKAAGTVDLAVQTGKSTVVVHVTVGG